MALSKRVASVPGLGEVAVIVSERGLVSIQVHAWSEQPAMRHRRDPVINDDNHVVITAVFQQLESFVLGRTRDFPIACDFHGIPPLTRAVMEAVRRIPYGQTRTYNELAKDIPEASEPLVRDALGRNPMPIVIPCHRAIGHGHMGAYPGPLPTKRSLLAIEGLDCRQVPDPTGTDSGLRVALKHLSQAPAR
jgi:methylated-DNA-[protein]-cysteine S-methyltransferase